MSSTISRCFPMVLLWFSHGSLMVLLWLSHGFTIILPVVFLWAFSMDLLWFPTALLLSPYGFLWFSYGFPMLLLSFPKGFPMVLVSSVWNKFSNRWK